MLAFIVFVVFVFLLAYLQYPLHRMFILRVIAHYHPGQDPVERYEYNDNGKAVERWEFVYTLTAAVLIIWTYFALPYHYTFPAVFDDDYVARYENGEVVKQDGGAFSFERGAVFRVPIETVIHDIQVGQVLYSTEPHVFLEGLRLTIAVHDPNVFFREEEVRIHGTMAHHPWMHELIAAMQKELFADMVQKGVVSSEEGDCGTYGYYERIRKALNELAEPKGFRVVNIRPWMGSLACPPVP